MAKRQRKQQNKTQVKEEPEVKEEPQEESAPTNNDEDEDDFFDPAYPGLTEYEVQRQKIIESNRQRLMALGIPSLMAQFKQSAAPQPKPRAPAKKKAKTAPKPQPLQGEEAGDQQNGGGGVRRSSRLRDVANKPKPETTEERFTRELGEFIVDGTCPKCGRIFEKNHKNHLQSCSSAPRVPRPYGGKEKEIMELPEEDRKDPKKRMQARMKALDLSGLVDCDDEEARFIVIGSTGNPYTIKLNNTKHRCDCLDFRFRGSQRPCKHLSLVLTQLGIMDEPSTWKEAVEGQLSELVTNSKVGKPRLHPEEAPPTDKHAQEALRFL